MRLSTRLARQHWSRQALEGRGPSKGPGSHTGLETEAKDIPPGPCPVVCHQHLLQSARCRQRPVEMDWRPRERSWLQEILERWEQKEQPRSLI